jgi:nucleoside-diphosphate-sugar epimerase
VTRVCVTGAAGRLGARLLERLGPGAVGFDQRPGDWTAGDILDPVAVERAVDGCDTVIHLAGLALAGRSFQEPDLYFEVNTRGTMNVAAACHRRGVQRVLLASTALVYAPGNGALPEDHPTRPASPYAASKLAAEVVLAGYPGLCSDVLRLANIYGADDPPTTVVGTALAQARAGRPIALLDLRPVRDFVHADDVVEAFARVAAADPRPGCQVLNVGTGRAASVSDLARTLAAVVQREGGPSLEVIDAKPSGPPPPPLVLDPTRLRERTGWSPSLDLGEGLTRTWRQGR